MIAFERSRGDDRRSWSCAPTAPRSRPSGTRTAGPGEIAVLLPGVVEQTSYNSGISWSPDGKRFVFMSNGGEGNYDLYLRELDGRISRITTHKEKDGHAHWSPVQDRIAFISGRSGKGDVYLFDLAKNTTRLTLGESPYLYPQWSPDGKRLAVIHGTNENHDVYRAGARSQPPVPPRALSTWHYDDLRPVWSPDGKRIAFYTNYNPAGDPARPGRSPSSPPTAPTRPRARARRAHRCDRGVPGRRARAGMAARQPAHRVRAREKTGVLPDLHRRRREPHERAPAHRDQGESRRHLLAAWGDRLSRPGGRMGSALRRQAEELTCTHAFLKSSS